MRCRIAAIHISLFLTIIATLCQACAVFLPGWMLFTSSFTGDVQMGVWYMCVDWKNCQQYTDLAFGSFEAVPKSIKKLIGQFIIPPMILMLAEFAALALLTSSVILCIITLVAHKRRRVNRLFLGNNVASCFIIMSGVISTVTIGGDFRIINTIGNFVRLFNVFFKVTYSYSFYLSVTAAGLSLFSAILCCCFDLPKVRKARHTKRRYSQKSSKSSGSHSKTSRQSSRTSSSGISSTMSTDHSINTLTVDRKSTINSISSIIPMTE